MIDCVGNATRGVRGIAIAPHSLAAQSALAVLRQGRNAVEAMVAAAASIAVVYPHMNSIGDDAFWLIHVPGTAPRAIDACGAAAACASTGFYREHGLDRIPFRGGLAANTVAGTVSGWSAALDYSTRALGGRLPLAGLLADAITYAKEGIPVTPSQHATTIAKLLDLRAQPGFDETFLVDGSAPAIGSLFRQPRVAATLEHLSRAGLDDSIAATLRRLSPGISRPAAVHSRSATSGRTVRNGASRWRSSIRSAPSTTFRHQRKVRYRC